MSDAISLKLSTDELQKQLEDLKNERTKLDQQEKDIKLKLLVSNAYEPGNDTSRIRSFVNPDIPYPELISRQAHFLHVIELIRQDHKSLAKIIAEAEELGGAAAIEIELWTRALDKFDRECRAGHIPLERSKIDKYKAEIETLEAGKDGTFHYSNRIVAKVAHDLQVFVKRMKQVQSETAAKTPFQQQ